MLVTEGILEVIKYFVQVLPIHCLVGLIDLRLIHQINISTILRNPVYSLDQVAK